MLRAVRVDRYRFGSSWPMQGALISENRKNIANFYALGPVAVKMDLKQGNHLPVVWDLKSV